MAPPLVAFVSFRLGLTDGVSIVTEQWCDAFRRRGWRVRTVAAEGPVDVVIAGLGIDATEPPSAGEVERAIEGADLVVVPNLLSLPLHPAAGDVVAEVLAGRSDVVVHHHDPSWQRARFVDLAGWPHLDPAWTHVVINELTRTEFAERGVAATLIHNAFADPATPGDRAATRAALGLRPTDRLALHPVRAIARKEVRRALEVCRALDAVYWLPGPAEEDYGPTLERLVAEADVRVERRRLGTIEDRYAACDLVVFPSSWEGFGNPPVEAAVRRRPVVVGSYPVAGELMALGFDWHTADDLDGLPAWFEGIDEDTLDRQRRLALDELGLHRLDHDLESLLTEMAYSSVIDIDVPD